MSKEWIPADLSRRVRARAGDHCEYCQLPQWGQEATFHVDHVRPVTLRGRTVFSNLALACVLCSLTKAAKTDAVDPLTGKVVSLFHPRREDWLDHFKWSLRWQIVGLTPTGRATVVALRMNRPRVLEIRRILVELDRFPPNS